MTTAAAAIPQGIFKGLASAKPMVDANYLRPGKYILRINKCKVGADRKMVSLVVNEFTVLKVLDNDEGRGHRVHDEVCHLVKSTSEYFLSEIKGFIAAIMCVPMEQITEEHAMTAYGAEQPLAGYIIEVHARNITTKKETDFTKISYKREVPASEALTLLDQAIIDKYFPNGMLQKLAELEGK